LASEPQYLPPPQPVPLPPPVERRSPRPGRAGILIAVPIAALVGALAGSGATILTAQQLSHPTAPGSPAPAPLAPITNTLTEESAVINVAKQAGKAVVEIKTQIVDPTLLVEMEQHGIGSGFIITSDGYIVTNNHVVQNARELNVILRDQKTVYPATIVGTSPDDDIAVLKINASNLPTLRFGNSDNLEVGQLAIAIGSPLGQQNSVTKGVISALHRSIRIQNQSTGVDETILNAIQTDASINPGNSGGPLLNSAGDVVGVNFAIEQAAFGPGLGFALNGNTAHAVAQELIQTKHVNQPYLGVSYVQVDETTATASGLPVGALVKSVDPGSPAARAGIRANDVITAVNGQSIDDSHPLKDVLRQFHPGDHVTVTTRRGAQTLNLGVVLGTQP
jgi:S1-C subfamily serine protease